MTDLIQCLKEFSMCGIMFFTFIIVVGSFIYLIDVTIQNLWKRIKR